MPHRHHALAFRASACTLLGATATAATSPYWPATLGTMGGALALAWCGRCEAIADRRDRVDAQRERLAARPAPSPPLTPCRLLRHLSDSSDHGVARTPGRALATDTDRGWADLNTACCLRSWESRGAEHDTTHCAKKDQAA
ncbi:hypothetical protein [Streptomyces sp. MNP-20]|uniref:hypothetical protein n=1 Tax=Streptomyces sp. MNP-20 TaxID=2721165 RepID=UPI001555F384|nr:hypothetical protein [Streptomyces sp. MNP-20]